MPISGKAWPSKRNPRCECRMPFGWPVVPDVYKPNAGASGNASKASASFDLPQRSRQRDARRPSRASSAVRPGRASANKSSTTTSRAERHFGQPEAELVYCVLGACHVIVPHLLVLAHLDGVLAEDGVVLRAAGAEEARRARVEPVHCILHARFAFARLA